MNLRKQLLSFVILSGYLSFTSCSKTAETPTLFEKQFEHFNVKSGFDNTVQLATTTWTVSYVKDETSGEYLLDSTGDKLQLTDIGTTVATEGILALTKDSTGYGLNINLKENFSEKPRLLAVAIANNGRTDIMHINQVKGEHYRLVEQVYTEIDSLRKIYTSDKECTPITLSNNSDKDQFMPDAGLFEHVSYQSEFASDDYGAFDWMSQDSLLVQTPDLIKVSYLPPTKALA